MNDKYIHKTRLVQSSLDEVWWRWTTHEGLLTFFGADNHIELRPGGAFEIYFIMDAPSGSRGGEGNQILSYLPKQMLSFSWNAPPSIPEIRNQDHRTWVVVQFEETTPGQSRVSLDHLGWLDGAAWDETFAYFDKAWDMVLNSLVESCTKI